MTIAIVPITTNEEGGYAQGTKRAVMKNYGSTKFTRDQLVYIVEVMIVSATDMLSDSREGRYQDGSKDNQWQEHRREVPDEVAQLLWSQAVAHLGTSLSVLWANLTNDGMGVSDALEITKLHHQLDEWASDWIAGRRGVLPAPEGASYAGTYDLPDAHRLAEKWVDVTFKDYLGGPHD